VREMKDGKIPSLQQCLCEDGFDFIFGRCAWKVVIELVKMYWRQKYGLLTRRLRLYINT
jgi:hypothetical protein